VKILVIATSQLLSEKAWPLSTVGQRRGRHRYHLCCTQERQNNKFIGNGSELLRGICGLTDS